MLNVIIIQSVISGEEEPCVCVPLFLSVSVLEGCCYSPFLFSSIVYILHKHFLVFTKTRCGEGPGDQSDCLQCQTMS